MKSLKQFFFFMLLICGVMVATSCSNDDEDNKNVVVVPEISGVTENSLATIKVIDSGKNSTFGYEYVNIQYQSLGADGQPIYLSELVAFPYKGDSPAPNPKNLLIGCHATITSDAERPTNLANNDIATDVGMMALHASNAFAQSISEALVVLPDYEGYGITKGNPHPYLYQELTARQVVDGVLAALTWCEANGKKMKEGWKSVSMGYSQGGAVAMGVQRYIEENNLTSRFNFAGSVCGDGPYDPVATLKSYIDEGKLFMPVAPIMVLKGICDVNPLVKGRYSIADYLTEEFLNTGIVEMIASKEKTTADIQQALADFSWVHPDGFCMHGLYGGEYVAIKNKNGVEIEKFKVTEPMGAYCEVEQVFRPEVIEYFRTGTTTDSKYLDKCKALGEALEMNVLTKGWSPALPMTAFHSTRDEVVPFSNYESARDNFGTAMFRGVRYEGSTYTHVSTGTTFFVIYGNDLMQKVLEGKLLDEPFERTQAGL